MRDVLLELREKGKKLFLATNSHSEYTNLIMTVTLGEDWENFFDLICCHTRKPLFFHSQTHPFHPHDSSRLNLKGDAIHSHDDLEEGMKYIEGNSYMLTEFFKKVLIKDEVKVAYFGDNYITDTYASSQMPNWHGFAIIEEMVFYDSSYTEGVDP